MLLRVQRSFLLAALPLAAGWTTAFRTHPSHRCHARLERRGAPAFAGQAPEGSSMQEAAYLEGVAATEVLGWLSGEWSRSLPRQGESDMPVDPSPQDWGLSLRYTAVPSDATEVLVTPLPGSSGSAGQGQQSCLVTVRRGEGCKAVLGLLGPQIASLAKAAERDLKRRLLRDLGVRFPHARTVQIRVDAKTGGLTAVGVGDSRAAASAAAAGSGSSGGSGSGGGGAGGKVFTDAEVVPKVAQGRAAANKKEKKAETQAEKAKETPPPSEPWGRSMAWGEEGDDEDRAGGMATGPYQVRLEDVDDSAALAIGAAALRRQKREEDATRAKVAAGQGGGNGGNGGKAGGGQQGGAAAAVAAEAAAAAEGAGADGLEGLLAGLADGPGGGGGDSLDKEVPADFAAAVVGVAQAFNLTDTALAALFAQGAQLASVATEQGSDSSGPSGPSRGGSGGGAGGGLLARAPEDQQGASSSSLSPLPPLPPSSSSSSSSFEGVDSELVRLAVAFGRSSGAGEGGEGGEGSGGSGDSLQGGLDLFSGPGGGTGGAGGERARPGSAFAPSATGVARAAAAAAAAAAGGAGAKALSAEEEAELETVHGRLVRVVRELSGKGKDDLFYPVMNEYKDVVLSALYPRAMRRLLQENAQKRDRRRAEAKAGEAAAAAREEDEEKAEADAAAAEEAEAAYGRTVAVCGRVNGFAVAVAEDLASMVAAAEAQQLETIRRICEAAMDDMASLPAAVRGLRPLLNADLVGYLAYAVDKERQAIGARFLDPDKEPTTWLQVLGLVRQGVHAELAKDLREDLKAIMYVLRMPDAETQRNLLATTVRTLPAWDARQFHTVASNIVANLELRQRASAAASDGGSGLGAGVDPLLFAKVAQLGRDLDELLPMDRLDEIAAPADKARGLLPSQMPSDPHSAAEPSFLPFASDFDGGRDDDDDWDKVPSYGRIKEE